MVLSRGRSPVVLGSARGLGVPGRGGRTGDTHCSDWTLAAGCQTKRTCTQPRAHSAACGAPAGAVARPCRLVGHRPAAPRTERRQQRAAAAPLSRASHCRTRDGVKHATCTAPTASGERAGGKGGSERPEARVDAAGEVGGHARGRRPERSGSEERGCREEQTAGRRDRRRGRKEAAEQPDEVVVPALSQCRCINK